MALKVLIVDDSRLSRAISTHLIQALRPGMEIFEASNASAALTLLEHQSADIGIVDMNMPGLSGLDLIQNIQEKWPAMRLALLTANIQEGMRERAKNLHVHFFSKPITEPVMTEVLNTLAPL